MLAIIVGFFILCIAKTFGLVRKFDTAVFGRGYDSDVSIRDDEDKFPDDPIANIYFYKYVQILLQYNLLLV